MLFKVFPVGVHRIGRGKVGDADMAVEERQLPFRCFLVDAGHLLEINDRSETCAVRTGHTVNEDGFRGILHQGDQPVGLLERQGPSRRHSEIDQPDPGFAGSLYLFLARTELGRQVRAAADNPYGALVIGTDVRRVYAVAFGIGAACVGAAGALVSPLLPFQPAGGLALSVASFNIVIIGGMGSLFGAFVGGLLVSVAESLGAVFLAPSMKELVSFSLLVVILLVRPAGLFGKDA